MRKWSKVIICIILFACIGYDSLVGLLTLFGGLYFAFDAWVGKTDEELAQDEDDFLE